MPRTARPTSGSAAFGLTLGLLVLAPALATAAGTFYVDGSSPNCSPNGPGTEANPYCTISAAVAARGGPGTTIYVKPGTYREQVSVTASGTVASPFVIQALGGRVVVDGANDYSGASRWTQDNGNLWVTTNVAIRPFQVFVDGVRYVASNSKAPGTFKYDSGKKKLFLNVGGGNPGLHQVLADARASGFIATGRSYVQIRGFSVAHTQDRGIMLQGNSQNVTLDRDSVTFSFSYGIHLDGGSAHRVSSCLVSDNGDHGIALTSGTTGAVIEDNECFRNIYPPTRQANGIYVEGSSSNRFERNRLHDNQDTGFQIQSGSNNNLFLQNLSWKNGDHGFDNLIATGNIHIGGVAWSNTRNGFSVEGGATGTQIIDCISVDNGLTTGETDLLVDAASTAGFVSDYNMFWNSTAVAPIRYSGTSYATVAAFAAATGKDTHSFGEDPLFTSPATGDFHLRAGSRAIDSGNSGVANWPPFDAEGRVRVDDPATPNTGVGTIAYADRGALEYAVVGIPPVAVLDVTPASGGAPLFVTADGSGSSDPDASIATYRFDFGDGTIVGPQPGPIATHTYPSVGTFNVRLTVSSSDGGVASTLRTVTVSTAQPPNGVIDTPASNVTITQGQSVSFTGTATDPDNQTPFTYLWDFGGGAPNQTVQDPGAVVFNTVGTFTVSFRVTDAAGLQDATPATRTVTVNAPPQPPNGVIDTPVGNVTITQGQSVSFTGTATDPDNQTPFTYLWDFGGGAPNQTVQDPGAVVFNTVGVFTVSFRVTDAAGLQDPTPATRTVTVNAPPQPPNGVIDTPVGNVTITQGQSVSFTGTGTDPDNQTPFTYLWDFGGGAANQTVEDPGAVVFNTVGTFTVSFRVTDAAGLQDPTPATRTVTVNAPPQPPNSVIDTPVGNVTITQGQSVSFTGTGTDPDNQTPFTYLWDFGGGAANQTIEDPGAVVFNTVGTFTVSFRVTDAAGLPDPTPATRTVTVNAPPQPPNGVIDTPASNITITQGQSVSFTGTATDPDNQTPFTYLWDFGGGATNQTVEDPGSVVFSTAGTFTVTFRVTDAAGLPDPTPATRTVTVNPSVSQPPNGVIDTPVSNVTITQGQSVSFTGTATDPDNQTPFTYLWDFGGGAPNQTVQDPGAVVFNTVGVFTVSFRVTDAAGLQDPTPATRTVTVNAPPQPPNGVIDTPVSNVAIIQGQSVSFTGTPTDPDNQTPFTYLWDFGGGAANQTVEDPGAVTFSTVGTFTVSFRVTDAAGLQDPTPATRTVTVTPPPQAPNGVIDTPAGNVTIVQGQSVTFTGTATDPDNQTPFTFLWDFGGGAANQTVEDPGAVVFNTIGTFTVSFRVTDAAALVDLTPDTRTVTVTGTGFGTSDQIHWTFTGQTSVTFDWRGTASSVRYGATAAYGQNAGGFAPTPMPWSSAGPFWEARITGLQENTVYHYSIGGGPDHTFHTPPPRGTTGFTVYAEGDIGDSTHYFRVVPVQTLIAQAAPAFVLALGDLTYGNANGIDAVDKHFNDVQKWSLDAAYMPAWGNHEWDDARQRRHANYKGRFDFPNPATSPGVPPESGGGEDWYWFDYGNVRFIAYPEPYTGAWNDWRIKVTPLMDAAQADPQIKWIVTAATGPRTPRATIRARPGSGRSSTISAPRTASTC